MHSIDVETLDIDLLMYHILTVRRIIRRPLPVLISLSDSIGRHAEATSLRSHL
jgi:hypothetical protein